MKRAIFTVITTIAFVAHTPAMTQAADFNASIQKIVMDVNTISEIYEKKIRSNGDVIVISRIACSDIHLVTNNGNIQATSQILEQFNNKSDAAKISSESLAETEREFFSKSGATEATQKLIYDKILTSNHKKSASGPEGAASLQQLGQVACQLKDKDLADAKEAASPELYNIADALANAMLGIAVAFLDIAITVEGGGMTVSVIGYVSTSWGWDHITEACNKVKAILASMSGKKGLEPQENMK